jgi:hypothetical protein
MTLLKNGNFHPTFLKWIEGSAFVVLLIGVALTSYNVYPLGIYFSLAGNALWMVLGIAWRKWSLIAMQAVITAIYLAGPILHTYVSLV